MANGLDRFQDRISPALHHDFVAWREDPELGALLDRLQAIADQDQFLNVFAEALVARHLVEHGCQLRLEVRTPVGRSCDFEVRADGQLFYLHVKRVSTERTVQRHLTISSRLRYLERLERPYIVNIRWHDGLDDGQMQKLVGRSSEFILRARVGDELTVRDDDGRELGGCRIMAPWSGSHVTLAIGLPEGFIDDSPRIQKLLRRGYQQFMPRAANVILVASSRDEDVQDVETALLGTHIERWDAQPPRGRRVAHGRAADGFWRPGSHTHSAVAGWFPLRLETDQLRCRLWFRDAGTDHQLDAPLHRLIQTLFEAG